MTCLAVVVGGRDKCVTMYEIAQPWKDHAPEAFGSPDIRAECAEGADEGAPVRWEVKSDDFVYCVAMSTDREYVVLGGTSKTVSVLSGQSGLCLFKIGYSGIIWALDLVKRQKGGAMGGTVVAVGGEFHTL